MDERGLSEVELRAMLDDATEISPARRRGRWLIATRRAGHPWLVVVEPGAAEQITDLAPFVAA